MARKIRNSLYVIARIFLRDLKRIASNPLAVVVILGVCVLPSLYAWYTIEANWDPYGNTDSIKVGVVNEDAGASNELTGNIDVGAEVVEKLKSNDELGWQFVSEDEALDSVRSGRYFAAIVIPRSFSQDFLGVLDGSDAHPSIEYYVNEKISAVAPRITDTGATTIEEQIDQEFVQKVSSTVIGITQRVGVEAETSTANALDQLSDGIGRANTSIDETKRLLEDIDPLLTDAVSDSKGAAASMQSASAELPALVDAISSTSSSVSQLQGDLSRYASTLRSSHPADETRQGTTGEDAQDDSIPNGSADDGSIGGNSLSPEAALLEATSAILGDFSETLELLSAVIETLEPLSSETSDALTQLSSTMVASKSAAEASTIALANVQANLSAILSDLELVRSSQAMEDMSRYLSIDKDSLASFLASPVDLKTELVYPVKNYGSDVTPFYSNLGLWVAGFILVALIRLRSDEKDLPSGIKSVSYVESYFGRWSLFGMLALVQGTILCVGDLALGIQCESPVAFIGVGLLAAVVYNSLIFALAFAFKHIGKAIGIILLIMQIPGSSGMYPVQMMPEFFQVLNPLLPFTYSIAGMRQAIGGIYGMQYLEAMLGLAAFFVPAFVIGLGIGRACYNIDAMFDRQLGKTGMLVAESTDAPQGNRFRLRALVKALLRTQEYRDKLTARLNWFYKHYPMMNRIGWVALFAQPLGVFLLMVLLPSTAETKVVLLALMVIGIIVVDAYLIVVKFTQMSLSAQLASSERESNAIQGAHGDSGNGKRSLGDAEGVRAGDGR